MKNRISSRDLGSGERGFRSVVEARCVVDAPPNLEPNSSLRRPPAPLALACALRTVRGRDLIATPKKLKRHTPTMGNRHRAQHRKHPCPDLQPLCIIESSPH